MGRLPRLGLTLFATGFVSSVRIVDRVGGAREMSAPTGWA